MKKPILILTLFFASTSILADPRPEGKHGRHDPVGHFTELLSLNEEQITQATEIFERQRDQIRSIRDENRKEQREAMKSIREVTHEELATILDAEQLETFEAFLAERKDRMGPRHRSQHRPRNQGTE